MATLSDISQQLLPNHFFHVFNRGINGQKIFYFEKNYHYFLKKYAEKTRKYLNTYAYCLLPNHFHFLVKVKDTESILLGAQNDYLTIPKALQKELVANGFDLMDMSNFKNLTYLQQIDFIRLNE